MAEHENACRGTRPLPPGFSLGIVGHRPERLVDEPAIERRLAELFAAIAEAVAAAALHDGMPADRPLRLVSALAEGADRIAARVAVDRGLPLVAVLPFPAPVYETEFADDASRDAFRQLLATAAETIVLAGTVAAREQAYDRAGAVLLDHADGLVAVWDGEPGRGRGGTRAVMDQAVLRRIPVVTVPVDGAPLPAEHLAAGVRALVAARRRSNPG